jgi:hypothetical protein
VSVFESERGWGVSGRLWGERESKGEGVCVRVGVGVVMVCEGEDVCGKER